MIGRRWLNWCAVAVLTAGSLLAIRARPLGAQSQPPPLLNLDPEAVPAIPPHALRDAGWRPKDASVPALKPLDATNGWRPKGSGPIRTVNHQPALEVPPMRVEPETPTLPPPLSVKQTPRSTDPRAALLLSAARNAVARGVPGEAVQRFEEYLALDPNDREVRREYAGILVQVDRVKAAIEQYRTLLADEPNSTSLLVPLADAYLQLKEFRKAAALLQQALERSPSNLEYAVKLARALAFDGDFTRAFQVFEKHIGRQNPGDARVPRSYGGLLVDLHKPEDAVAFLEPLREKFPDDLEVLSYLIRAQARLANRPKVAELIADLATRKPNTIAPRLELAESLYQSGDLEPAAQVYGQVLAAEPTNSFAQIGIARVAIAQMLPREAFRILSTVQPSNAAQRLFLLAWAEYHQLVGEYAQAKQLYRTFIEKDDTDNESRLALARLYEFMREDEKAKAEYAKIPPEAAQYRPARLGIVTTLMVQRKFGEAIELGRLAMRDFPNDPTARATLARVLGKAGQCAEAELLCREYLRQETRNEAGIVEVRLALGKVLLDQSKLAEAATEYESLLNRPAGRVIPAFYGLARARMKLGSVEQMDAVIEMAVNYLGDPRARLQLADQFVADVDDGIAGDLCVQALRGDSGNLAVLIRLADIRQRQASFNGHFDEAIQMADSVLRLSPNNVRGLEALARTLAIAQKFEKSADVYSRLIAIDPEFTLPRLERARVLYSDHQFNRAAGAYRDLPKPPLPDTPRADPSAPNTMPNLQSVAKPRVPFDVLHGEITRVSATTTTESNVPSPSQRFALDAAAWTTSTQETELEAKAKSLKGWRNYQSMPVYRQLIAEEPGNTEGLFDLGQVYSELKHTRKAIGMYGELLAVDPRHRDGAIAMDRASLELEPQLLLNQDFFSQRGRDGTASIDRYRYTAAARIPFGDENEYLQVGFSRINYDAVNYPAVDGNVLSVRLQQKPQANLLLHAQANLETFGPGGFSDRVTFDTGAWYEPCDLFRVYFSGFLENIAESSGSLAQDIYRGGVRMGGDVRPSRRWDFGGQYLVGVYSDKNTLNQFTLFNEVLLNFLPKQLKFVTRLDFQGFADQTFFFPPNPGDIVRAVHPYFSPQAFSYLENRIEWTHYLGRDYFSHANVCYYSLQYGMGYDNNFFAYHRFRALFNWDICSWASVGADSNVLISPLYNMVGASAYLTLRLPVFRR